MSQLRHLRHGLPDLLLLLGRRVIRENLKSSTRQKKLYSCNLVDFAAVAGGHNFRPENGDRLKYRYYHQHRGFAENANQQICVGCNRCGRACLADINPKDVINDLRLEKDTCLISGLSSPGKT